VAFATYAKSKQNVMRELAVAEKAAGRALERLEKSPGDASAALTAGRFLCFAKHDWSAGLPLLAKGSDSALAVLAQAEAGKPAAPAAIIALSDQYLVLAKKSRSSMQKSAMAARAWRWYTKALSGAGGLVRVHVEKKLLEAQNLCLWEPRAMAMANLRTALLSHRWSWGRDSVVMTFRGDGSVSHVGMGGSWEIKAPQRLLLRINNGDRMTLRFNTLLDRYVSLGRGFGGRRLGQ
jgi:hypothetical protein